MRLEHKVLIFLVILTQKSDDRHPLTCEKFNFFSLNERTLRRHDCQLWKLARRNGTLLLSWWWTNKKQMNLLWWRHLDFRLRVFFPSFLGEIVWKRAILNCTFLRTVYVMTSQGRLAIRHTFLYIFCLRRKSGKKFFRGKKKFWANSPNCVRYVDFIWNRTTGETDTFSPGAQSWNNRQAWSWNKDLLSRQKVENLRD